MAEKEEAFFYGFKKIPFRMGFEDSFRIFLQKLFLHLGPRHTKMFFEHGSIYPNAEIYVFECHPRSLTNWNYNSEHFKQMLRLFHYWIVAHTKKGFQGIRVTFVDKRNRSRVCNSIFNKNLAETGLAVAKSSMMLESDNIGFLFAGSNSLNTQRSISPQLYQKNQRHPIIKYCEQDAT